jgi:hypothetical protein
VDFGHGVLPFGCPLRRLPVHSVPIVTPSMTQITFTAPGAPGPARYRSAGLSPERPRIAHPRPRATKYTA